MVILLNGIEVRSNILMVNDGLNYGRFFKHETKNYEIHLTNTEFLDLIENEYNLIRDELQLDDKANNDYSDFTNTSYCSLTKLLKHEIDFENILKTYLDIPLFKKIFTQSSENMYVINSTDSIKVNNDLVIFKGRVHKITS